MTEFETIRQLLRYDEETGKLYWKPRGRKGWDTRYAQTEAFTCKTKQGYLHGNINGTTHKAHRVIWAMIYGYWPHEVDHINGDKTDNRLENLREVSRAVNCRNRQLRSDNVSGFVGVSSNRYGKWRSRIHVNGKEVLCGTFNTPEEAHAARLELAKQHGFTDRHGVAANG